MSKTSSRTDYNVRFRLNRYESDGFDQIALAMDESKQTILRRFIQLLIEGEIDQAQFKTVLPDKFVIDLEPLRRYVARKFDEE